MRNNFMKLVILMAVLALFIISFSSCRGTVEKEITVGASKKEILNRLGDPRAWFVLKPGIGLTVVSYSTPGSAQRPMPSDEIWLFEYEKPIMCIWLKNEVVTEVKKESCAKDNSKTSSSQTTTQSNSNVSSQNADAESRYKWQSKSDIPVPADGITIMETKNGTLKIGAAEGGAGDIPFGGDDVVIDSPGSRDLRIEIDPKVKKTTYAGLVFTTPCVLEIFDDTTLIANQEGVIAKDKNGKQWKSRKVTLDNKEVIAFFLVE